jgi:hypothetical protein
MAADGTNISLNDAQVYMHSRPLFISITFHLEAPESKTPWQSRRPDMPGFPIARNRTFLNSDDWGSGQENPVLKKFSS